MPNHTAADTAPGSSAVANHVAWLLAVVVASLFVSGASADVVTPRVAIIIDDLGYRKTEGYRALALPGSVTYAVLPHTPYAEIFARQAHAAHKEVLLHLPMESQNGLELGPGGLTADMGEARVTEAVMVNLEAVPHAVGISNHMGSLLSAREQPLHWLMSALKSSKRALFVVDSRTTPGSVMSRIADQHNVPSISRDVFLDHDLAETAIRQQLMRLVTHARTHGSALGIGHPHPQTLQVLETALPELEQHGVELVRVSELIRYQQRGVHISSR